MSMFRIPTHCRAFAPILFLVFFSVSSFGQSKNLENSGIDFKDEISLPELHASISVSNGLKLIERKNFKSLETQMGATEHDEDVLACIVNDAVIEGKQSKFLAGVLYKITDSHVKNITSIDSKEFINAVNKNLKDNRKPGESIEFQSMGEPVIDTERNSIRYDVKVIQNPQLPSIATYYYESYLFIPSREGLMLFRFDYLTEPGRISNLLDSVATNFKFDPGYAYNDFIYEKRENPTTNTILTAIQQEHNGDYANDEFFDSNGNGAHMSTSSIATKGWDFINYLGFKWVALAVGIIIFILLILYGICSLFLLKYPAPKDTDSNTKLKGKMQSAAKNIVVRLIIFCFSYTGLIVIALFFVLLMAYLTVYLIYGLNAGWFRELTVLGRLLIVVLILAGAFLLGLWSMVIGNFNTLTRPIRRLFKRKSNNGLEVKKADAPELWQLIEQTAKELGIDPPTALFINGDANASITFKHPFKSIWNPGEKIMSIGAPLFLVLSKQELKSVIAHEMGHVAQDETRQYTAASYASNIIYEAIQTKKADFIKTEQQKSSGVINSTYRLTKGSLDWMYKILYKLFKFVRIPLNLMSQTMEFDADSYASSVAGTKSSISALYKLETASSLADSYNFLIDLFIKKYQKLPADVIECFYKLVPVLQPDFYEKTKDCLLIDQPIFVRKMSDVEVAQEWDTHPDQKYRIEAMMANATHIDNFDLQSSFTLITPAVRNMIEEHLLKLCGPKVAKVENNEFIEWASNETEERTLSQRVVPFLSRPFLLEMDEIGEIELSKQLDDETLKEMGDISIQYVNAIHDLNLLNQFKNDEIDTSSLLFKGRRYTKQDIDDAITQQTNLLDKLTEQTKKVDKAMVSHVMSLVEDKEKAKQDFIGLVYSSRIIDYFTSQFQYLINEYMLEFQKSTVTEEEANKIVYLVNKTNAAIVNAIKDYVDLDRLAPIINVDMYNWISTFAKGDGIMHSLDETDFAKDTTLAFEYIVNIHNDFLYYIKKRISNIHEGKEPPGPWDGSMEQIRLSNDE